MGNVIEMKIEFVENEEHYFWGGSESHLSGCFRFSPQNFG